MALPEGDERGYSTVEPAGIRCWVLGASELFRRTEAPGKPAKAPYGITR